MSVATDIIINVNNNGQIEIDQDKFKKILPLVSYLLTLRKHLTL